VKKQLDETTMANELAGSAFFRPSPPPQPAEQPVETPAAPAALLESFPSVESQEDSSTTSAPPMLASTNASKHASSHASVLAPYPDSLVEAIRRVVKSYGKEVSYVRLSKEEKAELDDLLYQFKRHGLKTSENEINRVALNFMLADHRANGSGSVLARVLAALQA